jgi:hypothetical protein
MRAGGYEAGSAKVQIGAELLCKSAKVETVLQVAGDGPGHREIVIGVPVAEYQTPERPATVAVTRHLMNRVRR